MHETVNNIMLMRVDKIMQWFMKFMKVFMICDFKLRKSINEVWKFVRHFEKDLLIPIAQLFPLSHLITQIDS